MGPDKQPVAAFGSDTPSPRDSSAGKEALPAQEAGKVPVNGMSNTVRVTRDGNAPALPQESGSVPACMPYQHSLSTHSEDTHRMKCLHTISAAAASSHLQHHRQQAGATHHSPLIAHRSSLIAHRSSLIAHRSSLIAHRSSLIAHRSSLIAHRSSTASALSVTDGYALSLLLPCNCSRTCSNLPLMLQFEILRDTSCWNAVGPPHSVGRVPDSKLWLARPAPSIKFSKAAKPLLPQDGGSVPDRLVSSSVRVVRTGKAVGLAQLAGTVPVTKPGVHCTWKSCWAFSDAIVGCNHVHACLHMSFFPTQFWLRSVLLLFCMAKAWQSADST